MLTHPVFDIDHLAGYSAHVLDYDFATYPAAVPELTQDNSGSGSASTYPFYELAGTGPAIRLRLSAHPGSVTLKGPIVDPAYVKAVICDIEGLSYTSSSGASPTWGYGIYDTAMTSYVEMFRNSSGMMLTTQTGSISNRDQQKSMQGDAKTIQNASTGLLIDFTRKEAVGHSGYSLVSTTQHQPSGQLEFRVRAFTGTGRDFFNVWIRKMRLTIIR